jgi:hypothetical protein
VISEDFLFNEKDWATITMIERVIA